MTERQHEHDQAPADRQSSGLSTADMAAAGRNSADQASATPRVQDDAVPIEAQPQAPQMAPASPPPARDSAATTQTIEQPAQAPAQQARQAAPAPPADAKSSALLPESDTHSFRARWDAIQTGFVDEPRKSVEQADSLVAEVMKHLAEVFAAERAKLEGQWSRGDDVSTEDLRVALRRYRSFFDRLLSM